jgi:RNA polymerase sigma-70 factor (ECF subfamily)
MSARAEESRLVARAKQGDSTAVAEIYTRHHNAVYRYVYYRVSDESLAEDLTATVFVRMVESIDRFQYRGRPLLTWLYTIARNAVIDHHRRDGAAGTIPLDERLLESGQDVERAVDRALTRHRLSKAMRHLTEDQRQVILLKFIEGKSNEQAAEILGKSIGAVKSLQHRALAALQRALTAGHSG